MADLNPSNPVKEHEVRFRAAVRPCCAHLVEYAEAQGDRYFFIPALNRHRGVAHYYLEAYHTDDFEKDLEFARGFGEAVIDVYSGILEDSIHLEHSEAHLAKQLEYHTTYFFQVLTLDRGTTSGVLVHDQNDVGIMASLPSHVDKDILASWFERLPSVQKPLLKGLIQALPNAQPAPVDDRTRAELAKVVRAHYTAHPEALKFQASGDVTPPTVQNHKPE
jgi:coproporphyrinogen III oxidase